MYYKKIGIAATVVGGMVLGSYSGALAQTYEEKLAQGAATTKQNFLNVPFAKPKNWKTPYGNPDYWPTNYPRGPIDRSPKDKSSKVITLGTGDPAPNPYRFGPAHAVIANGVPYFVDAGEGWWRAVGKSVLSQGAMDLASVFDLQNLKYMFLTHLHEDHTVGLPSFISNPYKFGPGPDKKIYGPSGIDDMIAHINAAWKLDRNEMFQGSTTQHADGRRCAGLARDRRQGPEDFRG